MEYKKNSELLAYTGPKELLYGLERQRKYVLGIEAVPRACPNCGTMHKRWEILGITDVDEYDMSTSHPDEGMCQRCGRGLRWTVPFIGDCHFSLIPDPSLTGDRS